MNSSCAEARGPRLILRAVAWMLLAQIAGFGGSFMVGFVTGFVAGLVAALKGHLPSPLRYPALFALVSTLCLQSVLLFAALRDASIIGRGNRRVGLGWNSINRRQLVVILTTILLCCDCMLIFLSIHSAVIRPYALKAGVVVFTPIRLPGVWRWVVIVSRGIMTVIIAPLCEELFFRGWLWKALRQAWKVWPIMIVTGGLWLGMHLFDGLYRPLLLIPAAIILTSIRVVSGSVRASVRSSYNQQRPCGRGLDICCVVVGLDYQSDSIERYEKSRLAIFRRKVGPWTCSWIGSSSTRLILLIHCSSGRPLPWC
jgi:membrane protease YdiL (CAAX protease family)